VSGKLDATLRATHDGRSPDGRVTVTMSGGGELTAVRFDRSWLSSASAGAVARQVVAACGVAYAKVDAHGVSRLIADSPLGAAQRVTQDPFGLARRLRITD